jgi:hypothetical protein
VPADDRFFRKPIFRCLVTFHAELNNHSSEWVANVISQNNRLRTVNVVAREAPSEGFFAALWARRSSLKTLSLGVAYPEAGTLIKQIAASCPALQSLTIGTTGRLTGSCIAQGIAGLAGGCTDLRELKLSNCVMSNDDANQAVLRGLKTLRALESLGMLLSDALLLTLAECRNDAPYLTELAILWNVQWTDTVTQAVVVLANLRRLVLNTTFPSPPIDVLEAGLAQLLRLEDLTIHVPGLSVSILLCAVAQGSPNLRTIVVECSEEGSAEAGLIRIATRCPLLEKIHLIHGTITDQLLQALAQHRSRFRALCGENSRCQVTTAGLLSLVWGCRLLATLELHLCEALNDTVLQALTEHSYYLEKLRLPKRFWVSEKALVQLVESCKHLNTVWAPIYVISCQMKQRLEWLSRSRGRMLKVVYY